MSLLVVEVWFYYSKSYNCCVEIRGLLDDGSGGLCPPYDFAAPCRGFVGNCADVQQQFGDVGALPAEYECTQFPDEKAPLDKLIAGLIGCAVAIPFSYLLCEARCLTAPAIPHHLPRPGRRLVRARGRRCLSKRTSPSFRRGSSTGSHQRCASSHTLAGTGPTSGRGPTESCSRAGSTKASAKCATSASAPSAIPSPTHTAGFVRQPHPPAVCAPQVNFELFMNKCVEPLQVALEHLAEPRKPRPAVVGAPQRPSLVDYAMYGPWAAQVVRGGSAPAQGGPAAGGGHGGGGHHAGAHRRHSEAEHVAAGRARARRRGSLRWAGLALVYAAWGVMVWIIFTCALPMAALRPRCPRASLQHRAAAPHGLRKPVGWGFTS